MLSPLDLKNKKIETKKRKYDKVQMDEYLELVFENYKGLFEENESLKKEVKSLNESIKYYRSIEKGQQIEKIFHNRLLDAYCYYMIIGGMPEVVQSWVDTHDYKEVEEVQDRILKDYADDFGKHVTPVTATKIKMVWDSIPTQIARDNSKFIFSIVRNYFKLFRFSKTK